ncbi:MAG: copper chaperone PCu(A)C [Pseudomonadota bacterium]
MTMRSNQSPRAHAAGVLGRGAGLLLVLLVSTAASIGIWRFVTRSAAGTAPPVVEAYPLRVTDPRVRQPLPGTTRTAGYLVLENLGPEALVLVAAESPLLGRIEIHETLKSGDRVRMERIDQLVLPAGGAVTLEPGGKHLMIFGVTAPLPAEISITFRLLSGKEQAIPFRTFGVTES